MRQRVASGLRRQTLPKGVTLENVLRETIDNDRWLSFKRGMTISAIVSDAYGHALNMRAEQMIAKGTIA